MNRFYWLVASLVLQQSQLKSMPEKNYQIMNDPLIVRMTDAALTHNEKDFFLSIKQAKHHGMNSRSWKYAEHLFKNHFDQSSLWYGTIMSEFASQKINLTD